MNATFESRCVICWKSERLENLTIEVDSGRLICRQCILRDTRCYLCREPGAGLIRANVYCRRHYQSLAPSVAEKIREEFLHLLEGTR